MSSRYTATITNQKKHILVSQSNDLDRIEDTLGLYLEICPQGVIAEIWDAQLEKTILRKTRDDKRNLKE